MNEPFLSPSLTLSFAAAEFYGALKCLLLKCKTWKEGTSTPLRKSLLHPQSRLQFAKSRRIRSRMGMRPKGPPHMTSINSFLTHPVFPHNFLFTRMGHLLTLPLCQIWNLLTAGESYSDTSIFPVCGYFNFQASFCQHAQWKRRQKLAWYKRNHMQGRRKNVNMVQQQSWYPMSIFCADVKYRNPQKDVNPPG